MSFWLVVVDVCELLEIVAAEKDQELLLIDEMLVINDAKEQRQTGR